MFRQYFLLCNKIYRVGEVVTKVSYQSVYQIAPLRHPAVGAASTWAVIPGS
jgi:hypothetical protein